MTQPVLLTAQEGAVLTLTLNRPEAHNALDSALCRALIAALEAADDDESVSVVVLRGAGKSFCSGADTREFKHLTPEQRANVKDRAALSSGIHTSLAKMKTPVIAAVRGYALGGGCALALAADLVVADDSATFGYPEIKHGLVAAVVMSNLTRQIGRKAAMELVLTGRKLTALQAMDMGLVNRIASADQFEDSVTELAQLIASHLRGALRMSKGLFYEVADLPHLEGIQRGQAANEAMRALRG